MKWASRHVAFCVALVLIAMSGGVAYVIWPSSWLWWLGGLTSIPLLMYLMRLQREQDEDEKNAGIHFRDGGGGDGWGAP
jgi:hypothetical protein